MQKRSLLAALSLAAVAALSTSAAGAQSLTGTSTGSTDADRPSAGVVQNGVDATPAAPSTGYPGNSTKAGAQNQPRNGGATGSTGKAPNDGHPVVNPNSRANRNGAATGS